MQVNEVNEKIKVAAVFENNTVKPRWFYWGRNKHTVTNIEQTWQTREGEATILYFVLNDGSNIYEVKLNQKSLEWRLEKVYMEG